MVIDNEAKINELSEEFGSLSVKKRIKAIKELKNYENMEAVTFLGEKGLKDSSKEVRIEAASALLSIGGEKVKTHMLKALKDRTHDIKIIAIEYFGTIIDEDICDNILMPLLENKSGKIKAAAIDALSGFAGMSDGAKNKYINILKDCVDGESLDLFKSAVYALTHMDPLVAANHFSERIKTLELFSEAYGMYNYRKQEVFYECMNHMVKTIIKYVNQEHLEDFLNFTLSQFIDNLPMALQMCSNELYTFVDNLKNSDRKEEIFNYYKRLVKNGEEYEYLNALLFLMYLVQDYLSEKKNDWRDEEKEKEFAWTEKYVGETIKLVKNVLVENHQKAVTDIDVFDKFFPVFLREHYEGKYKFYRNNHFKLYLIPWLYLYGCEIVLDYKGRIVKGA